MRKSTIQYLLVFLLLFACSGSPQAAPTQQTTIQRSPVALPATWTPTASLMPSKTPHRTATQTFTPFPSATPLPSTLTSSPTSDAPTLTASPTITPTLDISCALMTTKNGISIHQAPFIDPYRVLPTLSPTSTYQAVGIFPPYYELELNGQAVGWVDGRQRNLETQGSGCEQLPSDTRTLPDFPSLCFFTPNDEAQTYSDRALLEAYQTITTTTTSVLLLRYSDVFYSSAGESGPGFFVSVNQVSTSGACENVPQAGLTTTNGWLWSQPDGETGEQLVKLPPAKRLFIQKGPVDGPKPPTGSGNGAWYFVLVSPKSKGQAGWVWSSMVFLE